MPHLKLVSSQSKPQSVTPLVSTPLHVGRRYHPIDPVSKHFGAFHGVVGGYHISSNKAEMEEISVGDGSAFYIWDPDVKPSQLPCDAVLLEQGKSLSLSNCEVRSNTLVLLNTMLNGPDVIVENGEAYLTLSPQFEVEFGTHAFAAQLAMINLVQAKRFLSLEDGEEVTLLDTYDENEAVLYMEDECETPTIFATVQQQTGLNLPYCFSPNISQHIPREWNGEPVETVTVLEQYTSYFMQRALQSDVEHIWTPVHAPISWGWSIRVGRRYDDAWTMVRRKVMRPISGHDGLQLPTWKRNSLACTFPMEFEV